MRINRIESESNSVIDGVRWAPSQAKREGEYVWECLQKELQRLLAELLDAPTLTSVRSTTGASRGYTVQGLGSRVLGLGSWGPRAGFRVCMSVSGVMTSTVRLAVRLMRP